MVKWAKIVQIMFERSFIMEKFSVPSVCVKKPGSLHLKIKCYGCKCQKSGSVKKKKKRIFFLRVYLSQACAQALKILRIAIN